MNPIEVRNLTKVFGTKANPEKAIDMINLTVKKGEIHGLLGPNGAGKTTLINILSGILTPTSGTAKVLGKDIIRDSFEIRKRIGVCYGGARFNGSLTAKQILKFYAYAQGMSGQETEKRIEELCELIGFKSFMNKWFMNCSRGMQQKISIAKSLINDPELIFMDEPTVGMDIEVASMTRAILKDLASQGKTILLTTHYLNEIEELCENISMISQGKIVVKGKINDVKKKLKFSDNISFVIKRHKPLDFLQKIKGIKSWEYDEGKVIVHTNSPETVTVPLIKQLNRRKIKFVDLEIKPASLEQVIMKVMKNNTIPTNHTMVKKRGNKNA